MLQSFYIEYHHSKPDSIVQQTNQNSCFQVFEDHYQ